MEAKIVDRPELDAVDIYLGSKDVAIYYGDGDPINRTVEEILPGHERRPFLRLRSDEIDAIEAAIVARREGVLAERQTLRGDVDDARATRDRLLALVEDLVRE